MIGEWIEIQIFIKTNNVTNLVKICLRILTWKHSQVCTISEISKLNGDINLWCMLKLASALPSFVNSEYLNILDVYFSRWSRQTCRQLQNNYN